MGNARTIARNSFVLALSHGLTKLFSVGLTAVAGRVLGTTGYGLYALGSAVVEVVRVTASGGLDLIVVRETTSDPAQGKKTARHVAVMKLAAAFVGYLACPVAVYLLGYPSPVYFVVLSLGFAIFFENLSDVCDAAFQGHERMVPTGQAIVLGSLVHFILGSTVLFAGLGLRGWALSFIAGYATRFAWIHTRALRENIHRIEFRGLERAEFQRLVRAGVPLLGALVVALLFHRMDILMLGRMADTAQVGLYASAVRIVDVVVLLPRVLATAAFPAMRRTLDQDGPATAGIMVAKSLRLTIMACATVAVFLWVLAPFALRWIPGPAFVPATAALRILIWAIALQGAAHMLARLVVAMEREHEFFRIAVLSLLTNFMLNVWWIPRMGIAGAAWATLVSYGVNVTLYFASAWRGGVRIPILRSLVLPLFCVLTTALVAHHVDFSRWSSVMQPGLLRALTMVVLWIALAFATRTIAPADVRLAMDSVQRRLSS